MFVRVLCVESLGSVHMQCSCYTQEANVLTDCGQNIRDTKNAAAL